MGREDLSFVRDLFSRYYRVAQLKLPSDLSSREFAFQTLDSSVYVRHLSFSSESELRAYLVINTPKQSYYSAAKYVNPAAADYSEAGWQGSELMFDIDADKLPGCQTLHLGGETELITESCVEVAKEALKRLLYILREHMGFSEEELMVYFSGNRGFHVIVASEDPEWLTLGSLHRLELVDYVSARGLDLRNLFRDVAKRGFRAAQPSPQDGGWRSLIAVFSGKEVSEEAAKSIAVGVDPMVTQDVSRLIRIPNSINGKTGLAAVPIRPNEIDGFKLDKSLSPFEGYAIVRPSISFSGTLLGEGVTLVQRAPSKVDISVALYLVLNGLANVIRYNLSSVRRVGGDLQ